MCPPTWTERPHNFGFENKRISPDVDTVPPLVLQRSSHGQGTFEGHLIFKSMCFVVVWPTLVINSVQFPLGAQNPGTCLITSDLHASDIQESFSMFMGADLLGSMFAGTFRGRPCMVSPPALGERHPSQAVRNIFRRTLRHAPSYRNSRK